MNLVFMSLVSNLNLAKKVRRLFCFELFGFFKKD